MKEQRTKASWKLSSWHKEGILAHFIPAMGKWSKYHAGRAPGLAGAPWGSNCQQSSKIQNVKPDPSLKAYKCRVSVWALAGPFSNRLHKSPSSVEATRCLCKELLNTEQSGRHTAGCSPGTRTVLGAQPSTPIPELSQNCPRAAPPAALPCDSCTSALLQETHPPRHWPQVGPSSPHPLLPFHWELNSRYV